MEQQHKSLKIRLPIDIHKSLKMMAVIDDIGIEEMLRKVLVEFEKTERRRRKMP